MYVHIVYSWLTVCCVLSITLRLFCLLPFAVCCFCCNATKNQKIYLNIGFTRSIVRKLFSCKRKDSSSATAVVEVVAGGGGGSQQPSDNNDKTSKMRKNKMNCSIVCGSESGKIKKQKPKRYRDWKMWMPHIRRGQACVQSLSTYSRQGEIYVYYGVYVERWEMICSGSLTSSWCQINLPVAVFGCLQIYLRRYTKWCAINCRVTDIKSFCMHEYLPVFGNHFNGVVKVVKWVGAVFGWRLFNSHDTIIILTNGWAKEFQSMW